MFVAVVVLQAVLVEVRWVDVRRRVEPHAEGHLQHVGVAAPRPLEAWPHSRLTAVKATTMYEPLLLYYDCYYTYYHFMAVIQENLQSWS